MTGVKFLRVMEDFEQRKGEKQRRSVLWRNRDSGTQREGRVRETQLGINFSIERRRERRKEDLERRRTWKRRKEGKSRGGGGDFSSL